MVRCISGRGQEGIRLNCSQGNSSRLFKRTFPLHEWNPESLKLVLVDFKNRLVHCHAEIVEVKKLGRAWDNSQSYSLFGWLQLGGGWGKKLRWVLGVMIISNFFFFLSKRVLIRCRAYDMASDETFMR